MRWREVGNLVVDGGAAGGVTGALTGFAVGVRAFGEPLLGAFVVATLGMIAGSGAGALVGAVVGVVGAVRSARNQHGDER